MWGEVNIVISERDVREACQEEHRLIVRCYATWNRNAEGNPELWSILCHHHVVLQVLRDYLSCHYGTDMHATTRATSVHDD